MGDHRHAGILGQMAEHPAQHRQRRVRPARWPRLQDHRRALGFGGGHIGAHVLPAQRHQTGNRIAMLQGRLQDVGKGRDTHLNFATISLMPGMVSIW